MSDIRDRIAEVLSSHGRLCEDCTHAAVYQDHVADVLVRELGLVEETRELADGYGGMTWDSKGNRLATPFKPCTVQRRYVTKWVTRIKAEQFTA